MHDNNSALLSLLGQKFTPSSKFAPEEWTPLKSSRLFITASFVAQAAGAMAEQLWLRTQARDAVSRGSFAEFTRRAFERELRDVRDLQGFLGSDNPAQLKSIERQAREIIGEVVSLTRAYSAAEFRQFCISAMRAMDDLARRQRSISDNFLAQSLYRAFDAWDDVFEFDYARESTPESTVAPGDGRHGERLYHGGGASVQTSYVTLLIALEKINPPPGARVIDLGSGFGRAGFVIGLLRPDLFFTGYEYVQNRVASAQRATLRAGLDSKVRFLTQDLSAADFAMPEAEVYYLYDPFNADTYRRAFLQLHEQGSRREIAVVTKGRACDWFVEGIKNAPQRGVWNDPDFHDEGTLAIFRSCSVA